jgi:hypothetical protein
VIELGFIIAIFLGWQFVVGEYIGGILLILVVWQIVRFTRPKKLIKQAKRRLNQTEEQEDSNQDIPDWQEKIQTQAAWQQVARKYFMEWGMVWKDVISCPVEYSIYLLLMGSRVWGVGCGIKTSRLS